MMSSAQAIPVSNAWLKALAVLAGAALLAATIWLASGLRVAILAPGPQAIELLDAANARLYRIDPWSEDVVVLDLHGQVSEIARLHAGTQAGAQRLSLSESGRVLQVKGPLGSRYFDTRSFRRVAWLHEALGDARDLTKSPCLTNLAKNSLFKE